MVEQVPLLLADECPPIVDAVRRLRRYWHRRHPTLPSFTLGAASYLDIPESGLSGYLTSVVRTRSRLETAFADVYERVRTALATHLDCAAVRYHPQLAPPGFHIFEAHPDLASLVPKRHIDLQHRFFHWEDPEFDAPGHRRSFTLPIALPKQGAGLYVWPAGDSAASGATPATAEGFGPRLAQSGPRERREVVYTAGRLVIHSGDQPHQIKPAGPPGAPTEVRLTLQGHAIKEGDQWWLYW